jgi:hypothetical protein
VKENIDTLEERLASNELDESQAFFVAVMENLTGTAAEQDG